ncbi:MAG: AsmA family protein [Bacteroidota bacterium]
MGKFIKRVLLWTVLSIAIIITAAAAIASFFEDEISERILSEIDNQLETKLEVKDFELSLLSNFPSVSANLKGVAVNDKFKGKLLEADQLSFRFGLLSLFGSNIKVNSVVVSDGALFIKTNRRGVRNFNILKKRDQPQKASAKPKDFALLLEEAQLENVELIYVDERNKQEMKVQLQDATFSGAFASDQFSLDSDAKLKADFIEIGGVRYFMGKQLGYGATIDVDLERGKYSFDNVEIMVEGNTLHVDGTVLVKKNFSDYDLSISGKDGELASIFKLLPEQYQKYISDFTTKGKFTLNSTVKGRYSASESPAIKMNLDLKDGRITSKRLEDPLKDVSFSASFTNGKGRSQRNATFEINDFKGYFSRELIESKLRIANFEDPDIDFQIDGVIPMASVFGLFSSEIISDGAGEIEFAKLKLKGRYKDMVNPSRIHRVKASGMLEFDDAELVINRERMIIDKGNMKLENNELQVDEVKIEGAGSELVLNGRFQNLIPVLFADKRNSKKAELRFRASLDSEDWDLDRFVRMLTSKPEPQFAAKGAMVDSATIQQIQERERITKFLKGKFEVNLQSFNYNKIEGRDFEGDLIFDNNEMLISGDVETMDGSMNLEGTAFFKDKPFLQANLYADDIDIREFFRQCENFGQDVLRYKHLKGDLNSRIAIDAYWDEQGRFDYDKLHVLADVRITDGELIRFKMLEDFSDYVKIRDLRHIRFTNMQNWLEVKHQKIFLPVMFLQSNALNMTINGQHSFENKIDYKLKVNAGQVLLNKFKKHDPKLSPQKAKRRGWFNLHYHVYGDIDDFKVENNKRLVKSDFLRSERRKREIKAALVEAFGDVRAIDEPLEWQDESEPLDTGEDKPNLLFEDEPVADNNDPVPTRPVTPEKPNKTKPPVKYEGDDEEEELEFLDVFDDMPPPKEKKKTDPKKKPVGKN